MKSKIDLVEAFREREGPWLCDLEPEGDPIREEKEYQDGFFKMLLESKINFKKRGKQNNG